MISQGDIHIWFASLDQPKSELRILQEHLNADESARADKIYDRLEKNRFVVARGTLREILGRYLGLRPCDVQICYNIHGKPFLRNSRAWGLQFNLAHSNGLALYALTSMGEIGVDLEWIRHVAEADRFAARFFADEERAVIHGHSGSEKDDALFRIWVRNEAYVKARGRGLSMLLAEGSGPRSTPVAGGKKKKGRWLVKSLAAPPGFAAAVAVDRAVRNISYWKQTAPGSHGLIHIDKLPDAEGDR
jgi:4'-phosphopantetheinyl transferase